MSSTQLDQLISLLGANQSTTSTINPTVNFIGKSLETKHIPWIIDSGASDHIISTDQAFVANSQKNIMLHVSLPDGRQAKVHSIGDINLGYIVLKKALYLPFFTCNLLSVSKLVKDSNCPVIFSPTGCVL